MRSELNQLMSVRRAIVRACKIVGYTQSDLARALDVDRSLVSTWVNGKKRVSLDKACRIEKLTGGKVTMENLRPDIK